MKGQPTSPPAVRSLAVPLPAALSERPDLLICRLSGSLQRVMTGALADLALNTGHHSILRLIADEGPGSQQSLGERLRIDRTTVVGLVDDLERGGLVRRERDPADRRAYLVHPTAAGTATLQQADERVAAAQEEMFAPLGPDGRAQLALLVRAVLEGGHLPGFPR